MKQLGWQALEGSWLWQLPNELEPLDMIREPRPKMMHRLREALRRHQLQRPDPLQVRGLLTPPPPPKTKL